MEEEDSKPTGRKWEPRKKQERQDRKEGLERKGRKEDRSVERRGHLTGEIEKE